MNTNQANLFMVHNTQLSQGRSGRMVVTGDGNTITQSGHGEITVNGVYCDIIQRSAGYIVLNGHHCRISQHTAGQLIIYGNDHEIRQYGRGYVRVIGTGNHIHIYGNGEVSLRGRSRNNYVAIHSSRAQVRDHGRYNTVENVHRDRERRSRNYQRHYDSLLADFVEDTAMEQQINTNKKKRLSSQQISQLPVSEVTAEDIKKKEQCSICIETLEEKEKMMTLPCFHRFHAECVSEWLEQSAECPLCRGKVKVHD